MNITRERTVETSVYRCGPHARKFNGTDEEWERMKSTIVPQAMTVTCPHCGSQNTHYGSKGHRECNRRPSVGFYDCPGYVLG